jgi:signal transduction histidine kinase
VLLVVATTTLVLVAFLVPLAVLLRTLATDRAVAEGRLQAQSTAAVVAVTPTDQLADALTVVDHELQLGVVLPDGRRVGPPFVGAASTLDLARSGRAFTASGNAGRLVLQPVDLATGRAVVWALVPEAELREGVLPAVSILLVLGVGLLLLTVVLADRLARGTVGPVRAMAATAHALGQGELSARAPVSGPPEVREVGHALNLLAERIGELLEAEREVVADLSHRLRTPLTRLRLDVDAVSEPEQRERLVADVEELRRQVDRVIQEARRQVRTGLQAGCDAASVVRERTSFWSVLFEDQERDLQLDVPSAALSVRLTQEDLGAAVDALVQNALVHTPRGTAVLVRVAEGADGRTLVTVSDQGPGLPAGADARGASGAGSTGLGLDIARRTAEASGGRLVLGRSAAGGAEITLELGPVR